MVTLDWKNAIRSLLAFLIFPPLMTTVAIADGARVALVIGNSGYADDAHLPNATSDAALIQGALLRIGFKVDLAEDLSFDDSVDIFSEFERKAASAEIALIYYAGHGMALSGENYLIPIDADISTEAQVIETSTSLGRLQEIVAQASSFGVVLFDACRTNPWIDEIVRNDGSLGANRGLVGNLSVPPRVIVGFSAQPGRVAYDGGTENGPYAIALNELLHRYPDMDVAGLLRNVGRRVQQLTGNQQIPTHTETLLPHQPMLTGVQITADGTETSILGAISGNLMESQEGGGGDGEQTIVPVPTTTIKQITDCDRQAGYTFRPRIDGVGRRWEDVNPEEALQACLAAIVDYPEEPFFYMLLARALAGIDSDDPRIVTYVRRSAAADAGFASDRMARIAFFGYAGTVANRDLAFMLSQLAAENGYPQALINMGDLFRDEAPTDAQRALQLFQQAQAAGLPEASAKIAWHMMNHEPTEQDYTEIRALYEVAAEAGFAWAINNLGWMDQRGQGLPEPSAQRAMARYKQACDLEHASACQAAGHLLAETDKPTYSDPLALEYFERGCDLGDVNACANIGWMHRWRDVPGKSDEIALTRLREGCEAGQAFACGQTGRAISDGLAGNDPNYEEALAFMKRGCDGDHGWSCRQAGHLLADTDKPTYSDPLALEYFERGCDLGDVNACANIGWMHRWRDVPGRSDEIALTRLREGCEAGEAWACGQTGRAISDGLAGNDPNYEEALAFMERGCEGNDGPSCARLGEWYLYDVADGLLPIDGEAVRKYFENGHRLGSDLGTANLIALLGKLPVTENIVDPDKYNWETSTPAQQNAARRGDLIHAIIWAQAVGVLTGPVERTTSMEQLIELVSGLPTIRDVLSDPTASPLVLEAQEEARRLLERHIDVMEREEDGGWAWGRLGGNTAGLLESLYSTNLGHDVNSDNVSLRNRLLILQSKLMAEWNPNGYGRGDGTFWGFLVRDLQSNLEAVGISVGGVDGTLGPATRRGIRSFQEAVGLPITGDIDPVTYFATTKAVSLGMAIQ